MAPQQGRAGITSPVQDSISLIINNETYTVGPDVPPWTRLVDYIRYVVQAPGTKALCREGGCGVCTVVATVPDRESPGHNKTFSVQACQAMLYACAGWKIETIEGLGNRYTGYHPIQKALHGFYGTQCGFCSPGMIMTMYGQTKGSEPLTSAKVEASLDGNICRCTGYRPILDAFKSMTVDADPTLKERLVDIEEAYNGVCEKNGTDGCGGCKGKEGGRCKKRVMDFLPLNPGKVQISFGSVHWFRPTNIHGMYSILRNIGTEEKYRIVVGNTGQGVFKNDGPYSAYISTDGIEELYITSVGVPLQLGANVSLTRAMELFHHMAKTQPRYSYLEVLANHWQVVANVAVRNTGSWAGNLMLKHAHQGFQSDIFLTLLAAKAELTIGSAEDASTTHMSLEHFLRTDMFKKVILSVTLPPALHNTKLRTFKITPRAVNAHAYVNACFRMEVDPTDNFKVTHKPSILLGGINPNFIHATETENFLMGRRLNDQATVVEAAEILGREVQPDNHPQDASPAYRRSLSQALLYKTIVGFLANKVNPKLASAGPNIERPLSSGRQEFDMDREAWPVGEPLPKLESATQISGEATYLDDIPYLPSELHGALVQTTHANAKISHVDASEALRLKDVVTFVKAADIPGKNSFVVTAGVYPDPVFVEERSKYAGQPVGLIVARDRDTAVRAAQMVVVSYEDVKKPVLTIEQALAEGGRDEIVTFAVTGTVEPAVLGDPEGQLEIAPHRLKGNLTQGSQYHLNMEPFATRVVPIEDGYDVYCTTQWPTETQATVAQVLGITANSINMSVRRIGGGYGAKISRQNVLAAAAAVAARSLQQPVRVVTDLNTNMTLAGWRDSYYATYDVGFEDTGKLTSLIVDLYSDAGHVSNESPVGFLASVIQNCYFIPNLQYRPHIVNTDTAANTWCRTPGHVNAIGTMENILDHIASYLKKDPLEVRQLNLITPGVPRLLASSHEQTPIKDVILPLLLEKANFVQRKAEVEEFNRSNRWKKRGIAVMPEYYGFDYPSVFRYGLQVSIYAHDGTVAITHGGIEMGQGINTKVAQVAAYTLGIPLAQVVVKASETTVAANSTVTSGSFGSDLCAHGVRKASLALKERMDVEKEKIKKDTGKEPTWLELVQHCFSHDVDLCERYWTAAKEHPPRYDIWAACCLEVEVDVLTGIYMIRRADVIEDAGRSMNPFVDVGQVEGAFIMGLGLFTSEKLKFDPSTGQKLSNGTWEYKPPTALDIPADLRVTLLPNAKQPYGVLGSKATGEPPLCLSYAVVSALRQAITAFRAENGDDSWFQMDTPLTVEAVQRLCGANPQMFKLG
ncbi:uncharacterized protein LOC135115838 isoform X1 [Scylla paramamosain]|uniref:uncharacterized protein LOC135115838 isoform X1 n=2 Tax=Scylla paramamosain TaxID=85552 RepID=UPI003082A108